MKVANCVTELIGNTPLIRLGKLAGDLPAEVIGKLEYFNPGGSIKDRAALHMVIEAERDGRLRPGGVIVEPTSGNTGIGLALVAATRGYRLILAMPESMSEERKALLGGLGVELVLTPAALGMAGSVSEAERIVSSTSGAIMLGQFENPANPKAHYTTTAEEIWKDTEGRIDVFVSAVGTGGTLTGVSEKLKEYKPTLVSVAVEPDESPLLSGGEAGPHLIQGIGAGFVPEVLDRSQIDRVERVAGTDAIATARRLIREEGIFCGISSGAAACAALRIAAEPQNRGKMIVFIVCDTADRYLSTELFKGRE